MTVGCSSGSLGVGEGGHDVVVSSVGIIVPLYSPPSDSTWAKLMDVKRKHTSVPIIAIVNPANGVGAAIDSSYTAGIATLKANGIVVIGYVATGWARRALQETKAESLQWKQFYPEIDGIFLDEMSNTVGDEAYYSQATVYIKSLGLTKTVGNPGSSTLESYVGTVDTMLIYESAGLPDKASFDPWIKKYGKSNFGIIPYAVVALDLQFLSDVSNFIGWIYLTNDDLPNPWDSLPPYLDDLAAAFLKI